MQEAHDTAGTQGEPTFGRNRSWLGTALLVVVAIAGVVAGVIIFTSDPSAPDAPPTRTDVNGAGAPTLTDEEAIDRYRELEQLALRAYRDTDASLLSRIYTTDSPTAESVRSELQRLTQDGVSAILTHKTESLEVTSRSPDEIELLQRVVVSGRIKGVGDTQVEGAWSQRQRRTIRTTLRADAGQWLIYRTLIVDVEKLGR